MEDPVVRTILCGVYDVAADAGWVSVGGGVSVCHFPPGTSKWNKIEHRMFSRIAQNWRGRPLVSREAVVEPIANTTTREGLTIRAELDGNEHPTGIKVSDEEMAALNPPRDEFHGYWNYTTSPRGDASKSTFCFVLNLIAEVGEL